LEDFELALNEAGARTRASDDLPGGPLSGPRFGMLWIIDRRQRCSIAPVVDQAVKARAAMPGFVLGLDLAGDEGTHAPEQLAPGFAPAFEACMPITIHAGEGESAANIWQAAYHLHADRIGHGLTLIDHPELAQRFRDRGIAIELCPSSNREVVGFRDRLHVDSANCPAYPLRAFMSAGLPLCLCTDNPAISRTTLADEYLAASRMSDAGLSIWEMLAIGRQGFVHSFLPAAERDSLRRAAEVEVFGALVDW
jgi:adenosine deaminase